MKLTLNAQDTRLYNKLSASENDLKLADFCLQKIMKKGWHYGPYEGRGATPQRQAAYTCCLVISYGRVFAQSKGMASLPSKIVRFNDAERACHRAILHLRNKVFAHIDGSEFETKPTFGPELLLPHGPISAATIRWPPWRVTIEQGILLKGMIDSLLLAILSKMTEIRRPYMEQLRNDWKQ